MTLSRRTEVFTDSVIRRMTRISNQYAITWGAPNFLEALAQKQSRFMGRPIDPATEIVATCGSTEAMMCAMPGSSFFRENANHLIRLHFAKNDETLYAAMERLEDLKKLKR